MKEAWQVVGVHTADINTAQASQAEKRPQISGDPLRAYRQGLMSAAWTPGLARDRVHGPCGGILAPRPGPAPSAPVWPLLAPAQGPDGTDSTPAPARPTARGWGCTDQGLCVLHESPTPVEYPRTLPSSPRPSCSTGVSRRRAATGHQHGQHRNGERERPAVQLLAARRALPWR